MGRHSALSSLSIEQLESLLNFLPVPLSFAQLETGEIMFMNAKFTETFGYAKGDFLTVPDWIAKAYPTEEQRQLTTLEWMKYIDAPPEQAYEVPVLEVVVVCKDGSQKIAEHSGVILPKADVALATFMNITERKAAEQASKILAETCSLTGLLNRRAFDARLEHEIWMTNRESKSLALVLADLDYFKSINDTYGHQIGDAVLKEFASRLRQSLRATDNVARLGGDKFALILSSVNGKDAIRVCEKILNFMKEPIHVNGVSITVGCSLGFSEFPKDASNAHQLFMAADEALYESKGKGRGYWAAFSQTSPK
jgi:diguanylate cyclase